MSKILAVSASSWKQSVIHEWKCYMTVALVGVLVWGAGLLGVALTWALNFGVFFLTGGLVKYALAAMLMLLGVAIVVVERGRHGEAIQEGAMV